MLACKFEIWQNLLGWNSSFSQCMIHEIIVWAYFHEINSSKKTFKTFWQIWKQIWRRNFALISKFFFDFNPAGEFQIAAKKKFENYESAADEFSFNIGSAWSQDSDVESSKRRFLLHCWKKQHFLVEKSFVLLKNERKFENETDTLYDQFDHAWHIASIFDS